MLNVNKLSFKYGNASVLKSIQFDLAAGERLVLVGESGCGKTTLLKAVAGLLQPSSGQILYDNIPVKGPKDQLVPGHEKIKLVNQDFGLSDYHTVEENIRLKLLQFNKDYVNQRIDELLKVTGLEKYKLRIAHQLSGGQKQRLSIARALADEPDLLLLDEPFNQLDYFLKEKIETYIDDYLNAHHISVILVSHSHEETMRWGERVIFLKSGKIVRDDSAENFYRQPSNRKEAGFFGKVNTVYHQGKYLSFRPHDFDFLPSNTNKIKLSVKGLNTINKGWYYDNKFKIGNQKVSLFHPTDITGVDTIYVKPLL